MLHFELQTAIATLDKTVMVDILHSQFYAHGVSPIIEYCKYKGVPLYLMHSNDGIGYVCTRAQMLYFTKQLYYIADWQFIENPVAFRVFPQLAHMQHREKGAQFGVTYTSLAKSHEYAEHAVLPI